MEHASQPETSQPPAGGGAGLSLLYTVAFDSPGAGGMRQMVKMLAGSVARTYFTGDMVIMRNSPPPVFLVQRAGIGEDCVEIPELEEAALEDFARAWKTEARHRLPAAENYEWVVFLDADCLCLRNIDHLLTEREGVDILYQPEPWRSRAAPEFNGYVSEAEMGEKDEGRADSGRPAKPTLKGERRHEEGKATLSRPEGDRRAEAKARANIQHPTSNVEAGDRNHVPPREWGVNSGTWAVRGHCYQAVMEEWERIQKSEPVRPTKWREQSAWNRLILGAAQHGWRAEAFEPHEIQFPLHLDPDWKLYKDAAIVHCVGGTNLEKIEFMFGLYMQKFFYDPACTLLNVVEM